MIKATVQKEEKIFEYPCMMVHTKCKQIVLFERHGVGTRLYAERNVRTIAYHSNDWNMEEFEPFTGTLMMANKETT
jgi:hypothetical protein